MNNNNNNNNKNNKNNNNNNNNVRITYSSFIFVDLKAYYSKKVNKWL